MNNTFRYFPLLLIVFSVLFFQGCVKNAQKATAGRNRSNSRTTQNVDAPPGYTSDAAFFCKAKVLDNQDKLKVFLTIDLKRGYENVTAEKFINRFAGSYLVLPDYGRKDYLSTGSIFLTNESLKRIGPNVFSLTFEIGKSVAQQTGLLVIEVSDLQTKQKSGDELVIHFTSDKIYDKYSIFDPATDLPKLNYFFTSGEKMLIKNLNNENKTFKVTRFLNNFDPAFSPLAVNSRNNISKSLKSDSTFEITTNTAFSLYQPGLYFFASDSSNTNGLSVLVTNHRFPRLTKPDELLKPLIYISSNEEINESRVSPEPKKALDRYWLRLASGNEDLARRSVKLYYRRVSVANELFSNYKDGWKTDMGMVFIVFGPPDKITRLKDRKVWSYTANPRYSEINFTFMKRPNQFTENNYELIRYAEYEPIWIPMVEEWRSGTVN